MILFPDTRVALSRRPAVAIHCQSTRSLLCAEADLRGVDPPGELSVSTGALSHSPAVRSSPSFKAPALRETTAANVALHDRIFYETSPNPQTCRERAVRQKASLRPPRWLPLQSLRPLLPRTPRQRSRRRALRSITTTMSPVPVPLTVPLTALLRLFRGHRCEPSRDRVPRGIARLLTRRCASQARAQILKPHEAAQAIAKFPPGSQGEYLRAFRCLERRCLPS